MKKWLLIIFVLACFQAVMIRMLYIPKANIAYDEAHHIQTTFDIATAFANRNWSEFMQISNSLFAYPFLGPWIIGIPLSFVGNTFDNIRALNLIFFIGSAILIYILAYQAFTKNKKIIAIISALTFIFSPMLMLLSSLYMKEIMGVFMTLLCAIAFIHTRKNGRWQLFLASVCLMALTLVKQYMGWLILMGFAAEELFILGTKRNIKYSLRRLFFLYLPYFIIMGTYYYLHLDLLKSYLFIQSTNVTLGSGLATWDKYLLFYPFSIVYAYSPSPAIGYVFLTSFFLAIFYLTKDNLRFLFIACLINLGLGIGQYGNMQERYISMTIAYMFIVGAFVAVDLMQKLSGLAAKIRFRHLPSVLFFIIITVSLPDFLNLYKFIYPLGSYSFKTPVFMETDYDDLWFEYDVKKWPKNKTRPIVSKPLDILAEAATAVDLTKPVTFGGESNLLSHYLWEMVASFHLTTGKFTPNPNHQLYKIILAVDPQSPLYTHEFRFYSAGPYYWSKAEIDNDPELVLFKEKQYPDIGVNLQIYTK